jgi:regulator of protease activity HflC (stomatin/prohibitin superfamily)
MANLQCETAGFKKTKEKMIMTQQTPSQLSLTDTIKNYSKPSNEHTSLGWSLRAVLFFIPAGALALVLWLAVMNGMVRPPAAIITGVAIVVIWKVLVSGIRIAAQWERGVVLRFGNMQAVRGPGLLYIIPIIEYVRFIDTRTVVFNIPAQKVITKDNVPAAIDGALFFMVKDPEKAVVQIQDFKFAIAQYSQAALRDVIGGLTLDEMLSERQQIQTRIGEIVEERIKDWGLHIDSIRLQDIELPEDLKRIMSRQASAEREKRATITKAEGDKLAAVNLAAAADIMKENPIAFQLRTLQTIDGLGPTPSNTVVLFPIELVNIIKAITAPQPKQ